MTRTDMLQVAESLSRLLSAIDEGQVTATPQQIAFLAGSLDTLRRLLEAIPGD